MEWTWIELNRARVILSLGSDTCRLLGPIGMMSVKLLSEFPEMYVVKWGDEGYYRQVLLSSSWWGFESKTARNLGI